MFNDRSLVNRVCGKSSLAPDVFAQSNDVFKTADASDKRDSKEDKKI